MTGELTCAGARELLPELALGTLAGDDRARLLDHLGTCDACATESAELTAVVDEVVGQLAPRVDPPAGFESRVLARIAAPAPAPATPWWKRPATLVAAVALVLAGTTTGLYATRRSPTGLNADYVQSLQALGGKELRAAALTQYGRTWGQAFVYEGKRSWVFVSMSWDVPDGAYSVVLDRSDGPSATVGSLHLVRGEGSTGTTVGDTRTVTVVRVVDASGHTLCQAVLPT
ncbi:MAG TPA: zf-HC2 domain-containing protein [Acidimicrobiales bacterium]|nr:zf-HC2 domain-containing protein [Acidimicrobiales bacterium]